VASNKQNANMRAPRRPPGPGKVPFPAGAKAGAANGAGAEPELEGVGREPRFGVGGTAVVGVKTGPPPPETPDGTGLALVIGGPEATGPGFATVAGGPDTAPPGLPSGGAGAAIVMDAAVGAV
jgi:hypothetical protein